MPLFWSIATILVAITLAALLWPLLRRSGRSDAPDAEAAVVAIFRDQKRALDAERASGAITAEESDTALTELARRVSEETERASGSYARPHSRRPLVLAVGLLLFVPVTAFVLYQRLGNPGATIVADIASSHDVSEQQIVAMVDSLAQKLKQHPDDAGGWVLLARSYQTLGRFPEAADAYAHAETLLRDDPSLLADYADVLAMAQGKRLAGKPAALVERALAIDPTHKKALALAASVALEAHDPETSLGYWRRLAAVLPPGSDEARQVADVIAEIESAQPSGKKSAQQARVDAAPRAAATAPPNSQTRTAAISGRVDLAPALASKVALNDTVFIFARAPEGSRMPLAVLRVPARELPKSFLLDDSMAMAPDTKLSGAPAVIVEARISKAGSAIPQPGDLYGRSAAIKPGTAGVNIIIDQVVQ